MTPAEARSRVQALPDLSDAAVVLLGSSACEIDNVTGIVRVLCPAGTSFDAAEALRLELVAKLPALVAVDVQIAPSPPGELCAEDEAGARLFASERAERLNPPPSLDDPWDEPEGGEPR